MRTFKEYPDRVYLNMSEYLFYSTAKRAIASLDECIKLAKTPEQKLGLSKRRNELSRNYAKLLETINGRLTILLSYGRPTR